MRLGSRLLMALAIAALIVPGTAGMAKADIPNETYEALGVPGVEKFILATDGDEPGRALAEELARRLGRGRDPW